MLNKRQTKQLEAIDAEFENRDIKVVTHVTSRPHFDSISISVIERDSMYPDWSMCLDNAIDAIREFDIKMSARYITEMLQRHRICGVAIHSNRDELDPPFGEFVAKARLLKHIKKMEQ